MYRKRKHGVWANLLNLPCEVVKHYRKQTMSENTRWPRGIHLMAPSLSQSCFVIVSGPKLPKKYPLPGRRGPVGIKYGVRDNGTASGECVHGKHQAPALCRGLVLSMRFFVMRLCRGSCGKDTETVWDGGRGMCGSQPSQSLFRCGGGMMSGSAAPLPNLVPWNRHSRTNR